MQTSCITLMKVCASSPRRSQAVVISSLLVRIIPMREMTSGGGKGRLIKRFQAGVSELTGTDESGTVWVKDSG